MLCGNLRKVFKHQGFWCEGVLFFRIDKKPFRSLREYHEGHSLHSFAPIIPARGWKHDEF